MESCSTTAGPNPWKLCSVTKVEEVKMMGRLLPIWATTIIFWTTYAQMITFSVEQASTMNRTTENFQIPAGSLTVFFVSAILLTCAVYDRVIMPLWKKWKGKPGFSSIQRIAIGLVLSTIGMAVVALAEMKRLSVAKSFNRNSTSLPISVFLLIVTASSPEVIGPELELNSVAQTDGGPIATTKPTREKKVPDRYKEFVME